MVQERCQGLSRALATQWAALRIRRTRGPVAAAPVRAIPAAAAQGIPGAQGIREVRASRAAAQAIPEAQAEPATPVTRASTAARATQEELAAVFRAILRLAPGTRPRRTTTRATTPARERAPAATAMATGGIKLVLEVDRLLGATTECGPLAGR